MERLRGFLSGAGGGLGVNPPPDSPLLDSSEQVYISSLALLKMLKHGNNQSLIFTFCFLSIKIQIWMTICVIGRAGVPMEVMGLMLGDFVDEYTVRVVDVFAMPQSSTGVSVEAVDPVFQTNMLDMLKQTGRYSLMFLYLLNVEKFDGKINFGLWQIQVQDILIQGGLRKTLKMKSIPKTLAEGIVAQKADEDEEEDWEDLDSRATSGIRLCIAKNVLANVAGEKTTKGLWEKLESLYQTKSLSNHLYLKEQLHTLKMNEGTSVGDYLGSLNGIVSEFESIGVKVEDEDKALQLIWSLPSSFKHLQPTLMFGKETLSFEEVTSTLLSEERRLKGSESFGENSAMVVSGKKSFNKFIKGTCWSCGQSDHYRSDCKAGKGNGASSARVFESDTNKLATVTSNDGGEALLVMSADGSRHDRGWVFDSPATTH
ncbi:hypothetical protein GIB67_010289, partial [Kingdonia uniflora]